MSPMSSGSPYLLTHSLSNKGDPSFLTNSSGTRRGNIQAFCFLCIILVPCPRAASPGVYPTTEKAMTRSSMLGASYARGTEKNPLFSTMPCSQAGCLAKGSSKNLTGQCYTVIVVLLDVTCPLKLRRPRWVRNVTKQDGHVWTYIWKNFYIL